MAEWWDSLTGDLQVFYLIGVISGLFLALQLVLTAFGADTDIDADAGDSGGSTVGFLSVRSLTAFLFAFGWTGAIMKQGDHSTPVSVAVAIAAGTALFFVVAVIWRKFATLDEDGSVDYRNAVGSKGNVYLPISADRSGRGKVEVTVQGRLSVVDAYTTSTVDLPSRTRVTVTAILDPTTVLVEPS